MSLAEQETQHWCLRLPSSSSLLCSSLCCCHHALIQVQHLWLQDNPLLLRHGAYKLNRNVFNCVNREFCSSVAFLTCLTYIFTTFVSHTLFDWAFVIVHLWGMNVHKWVFLIPKRSLSQQCVNVSIKGWMHRTRSYFSLYIFFRTWNSSYTLTWHMCIQILVRHWIIGVVGDYFSSGGCNEDYWVLLLGLQHNYTVWSVNKTVAWSLSQQDKLGILKKANS